MMDAVVVAADKQISTNLEDEAIILNLQDGSYYNLNSVGARIWNLLQKPRAVKEIIAILLEEYDVEPQRCQRDLFKLLQEMSDRGLIAVRDGKI